MDPNILTTLMLYSIHIPDADPEYPQPKIPKQKIRKQRPTQRYNNNCVKNRNTQRVNQPKCNSSSKWGC
jgi:hypothetical protein